MTFIQKYVKIFVNIIFHRSDVEKIKVNGKETAPLYKYLKEQKPGRIQWNFAKFLIDRDGNVVERFAPTAKPQTLEESIEKQLQTQASA